VIKSYRKSVHVVQISSSYLVRFRDPKEDGEIYHLSNLSVDMNLLTVSAGRRALHSGHERVSSCTVWICISTQVARQGLQIEEAWRQLGVILSFGNEEVGIVSMHTVHSSWGSSTPMAVRLSSSEAY
jgi:hypothetical protein